jgi:hypothetical protein
MQVQPDINIFTGTITSFISLPVIIFSLACYIVVLSIKKTVDTFWINNRRNKVWSDLILPGLPWIIGGVAALLFRQYPYPVGIVAPSARFAFGAVCGFLSSYVYRLVRAFLPKDPVPESAERLSVRAPSVPPTTPPAPPVA